MGTATSENGITEHLPSDRPPVYPCPECKFARRYTKLGLQRHRRECLHRAACMCIVCRWNRHLNERPKLFTPVVPLLFKSFNLNSDASNKTMKYLEDFVKATIPVNGSTTNQMKGSGNIVSSALKDVKNITSEGKSESSDSSENSQSDDSQLNRKRTLLYIKPVSAVDLNSKKRPAEAESPDSTDNNHDGEPCSRKLFCTICKLHVCWEAFGVHVIRHSIKIENGHLVCPQCNQTFRSPNLYLMHFPTHLEDHNCNDCYCKHPKCSNKPSIPSSEHSYAEEGTCFICLKSFDGIQSVLTHLKQHCKEYPFTCEECNRSFRQTGNLQRHLLAHRGEKPHKCRFCPSGFSDPATLRNHERVHTKEQPFVCKICNRGFTQVGNLKRHMALHVEKANASSVLILNGDFNKKSVCVVEEEIGPDDEKSSGSELFSDQEARNLGEPQLAGESQGRTKKRGKNGHFKLHMCKLCGKKYAWRHDLNIHFRTHTGEKPYKCELCDKKFAQSGAVRMHKVRHHNKPKFSPKKTSRLKLTTQVSSKIQG